MKTVRLKDNEVWEIIPEDALPAADWYGPEFAEQCVEAPDEVEQRWVYDLETGTFSPPPEPVPVEPEPPVEELMDILLGGA